MYVLVNVLYSSKHCAGYFTYKKPLTFYNPSELALLSLFYKESDFQGVR